MVHAPPQVALKSKHWAANAKQQQQQGGTASKQQKQKQRPPKQHTAQAAGGDDGELQQMREQLIESYRAGRPAPQGECSSGARGPGHGDRGLLLSDQHLAILCSGEHRHPNWVCGGCARG